MQPKVLTKVVQAMQQEKSIKGARCDSYAY
jgi:hypothetical protein